MSGYSPSQPAPTSGYRLECSFDEAKNVHLWRAECQTPGCQWKSGNHSEYDWRSGADLAGRRHAAGHAVGEQRGLNYSPSCGCRSCLDSRDAHTQNAGVA